VVRTGSWWFAFLNVFLLALTLQASVEISATVDRNQVAVGDMITLTISLSSGESLVVGDQRLPELDGFELVNQWSGRESRSVFSGGKFQFLQTQKFHYSLQATKKGKLTIPPVEVVANNTPHKTKEIVINVVDQGSRPQKPAQPQGEAEEPDPFFRDADDLFSQLLQRHGINPGGTKAEPGNPDDAFSLQLEVDKSEAFVGEQVTASWYIYTRHHIQNIDTLKYPNLKSFWKEDIELATRLNFQQEVVNGIPYKKALLVSYALFPIKEGQALIDTYKAKCNVVIGGPGVFGMGQAMNFTKASPEVRIKVKPLPSAGRPADFSGGVGEFEVRPLLGSKNVAAHQPLSYKIRFEGRGNAKTIELPPLQLPANLELYDTKSDTKFFKDGSSYKEFELLLIPRQEGKLEIPAISVSLFDPKKMQFYQKSVSAIELAVSAGRGLPNQISTSAATGDPSLSTPKKNVEPLLIVQWDNPSNTRAQNWGWVAAFLAALLILGWKAVRELGIGERRRSLKERAAKRFKHARKLADENQWRAVGAETTNIIYFILAELAGEKGANIEVSKLVEKLPPSIRQELGEKIRVALRDFETLSFAPEGAVGSLKEPRELKSRLDTVEGLMYRAIALGTIEESNAGAENLSQA
jgi:hypothetical protein